MFVFKIISNILLLIVLVHFFLLPLAKELANYLKVKQRGIGIMSKIISFTQYTESEGLIRYTYTIEYVANELTFHHELLKTGFGKPIVGQEIKIIYDKYNPDRIFKNSIEERVGLIVKLLVVTIAMCSVFYFNHSQ